jgi:predicted short-subunit dehydrogenase-like oxidoreductase (DUF2520 family)
LKSVAAGCRIVESAAPLQPGAPDLVLLTVSDAAIPTAAALLDTWGVPQHVPVVHCSGRRAPTGFAPGTRPQGSAHPAFSFPVPGVEKTGAVRFLVGGDDPATEAVSGLLERAGLGVVAAFPSDRILYHAGCVAAANILALAGLAADTLLRKSGLNPGQARELLSSLLQSVLANTAKLGFRESLTGPAVRGDAPAVLEQADAVLKHAVELLPFFLEANRSLGMVAGRKDVVAAIIDWAGKRAGRK